MLWLFKADAWARNRHGRQLEQKVARAWPRGRTHTKAQGPASGPQQLISTSLAADCGRHNDRHSCLHVHNTRLHILALSSSSAQAWLLTAGDTTTVTRVCTCTTHAYTSWPSAAKQQNKSLCAGCKTDVGLRAYRHAYNTHAHSNTHTTNSPHGDAQAIHAHTHTLRQHTCFSHRHMHAPAAVLPRPCWGLKRSHAACGRVPCPQARG